MAESPASLPVPGAGWIRSRAPLLRSMGWGFAGRVAFSAAGVALTIVTARILGPSDRGILTLSILAGAFAGLVPKAISASLAHRLALVARDGGDPGRAAAATRDAWTVALGAGLVAVGIACPVALVVADDRSVGVGAAAIVGASVLVAGPVGIAVGSSLARGRMGRHAVAIASYQVGALIGALGAVLLAGGDLLAISLGWAAGALLGMALGVPRDAVVALWRSPRGDTVRAQVRYTVRNSGALLLGLACTRADLVLLGILSGTTTVGLYSVAIGTSELVLFLANALEYSVYARIGTLARPDAWHLARRVALYSMGIATAQALVLAAVAHPAMAFVFGEPFREAGDFLLILLLGTVLASGQNAFVAFFLNNLGRPGIPLALSAISLAVVTITGLLLIPSLDGHGAAIASAAGYCAAFGASLVVMLRVRERG